MSFQAAKEAVAIADNQDYIEFQTEEVLKRFTAFVDTHDSGTPTKFLRRTADLVEEVIFETDINGVRYYLMRSQPQSSSRVSLSPRELAIARLIMKGLPNKCIGDILDISPWTVATHLRRIFVKLGVTSRAAMVARLVEENLQ
jgi:DNA-binding CsgD family transcriptional regulator